MKKLVGIILTVSLVLLMPINVMASTEFSNAEMKSKTLISDQEVKQYFNEHILTQDISVKIAQAHMNTFTDSVTVKSIEELYDFDDNITGYCISFENDGSPSGYVVISRLSQDSPIVEFSLEGKSITEELEDYTHQFIEQNNNIRQTSSNLRTYFGGAGDFYSEVIEGNKIKIFDPNEMKLENKSEQKNILQFKIKERILNLESSNMKTFVDEHVDYTNEKSEAKTNENTIGGGFTNTVAYTGYDRESKTISKASSISWYIMTDCASSSAGVCSPTAGLNIMKYFYICGNTNVYLENNAAKTYKRLYKLMGTSDKDGTTHSKIAPALTNYLHEQGYEKGYADDYTFDLWSDFTRDINKNLPIHTGLAASDGKHSVVTIGYVQYKTNTGFLGTAVTNKYLKIVTGWYREPKYIQFNNYYDSINGRAVHLS